MIKRFFSRLLAAFSNECIKNPSDKQTTNNNNNNIVQVKPELNCYVSTVTNLWGSAKTRPKTGPSILQPHVFRGTHVSCHVTSYSLTVWKITALLSSEQFPGSCRSWILFSLRYFSSYFAVVCIAGDLVKISIGYSVGSKRRDGLTYTWPVTRAFSAFFLAIG